MVEDTSGLQAWVTFDREFFVKYNCKTTLLRIGVSLGLFVDCLTTFSVSSYSNIIEIRYSGPQKQLLLRFVVDPPDLMEVIDDLESPGSDIQIKLQPAPPAVIFTSKGHGDLQLQINLNYSEYTDLLLNFSCDWEVSHRYKYEFLRATISNIPSSVIIENRAITLRIGSDGMLKVGHIFLFDSHQQQLSSHVQQQMSRRVANISFLVKPVRG